VDHSEQVFKSEVWNSIETKRTIIYQYVFFIFALLKGKEMSSKEIKCIKIEDFKNTNFAVDYVDEDFVLVRDFKGIPIEKDHPVKMDCFFIIHCIEGNLRIFLNGKEYQLETGNVLFCLPTMVINRVMTSVEHQVKIVGFSTRLLSRVIPRNKGMWNTGSYLYQNPVHQICEENIANIRIYNTLVEAKIEEINKPYSRHILHILLSALFCEIIYYFQTLAEKEEIDVINGFTQAEQIFRRFLNKVVSDQGIHRSVEYYATELFYTPKYLSKIVRQVSGKKPSTIIHEQAIEHIKYQLKRTDKPIKQIADEFEFPNISFFGKYVKKHLGVSPLQYRKVEEK
jgi:AraC-like DNA-binding protein